MQINIKHPSIQLIISGIFDYCAKHWNDNTIICYLPITILHKFHIYFLIITRMNFIRIYNTEHIHVAPNSANRGPRKKNLTNHTVLSVSHQPHSSLFLLTTKPHPHLSIVIISSFLLIILSIIFNYSLEIRNSFRTIA